MLQHLRHRLRQALYDAEAKGADTSLAQDRYIRRSVRQKASGGPLIGRAQYAQYKRAQGEKPPTVEELLALARRNPDTLYLEWSVSMTNSVFCSPSRLLRM